MRLAPRSGESTEDEISKPGRNDPCHCGSGKKYKKCHLAADASERSAADAAARAKRAAEIEAEQLAAAEAEGEDESEAAASPKKPDGSKKGFGKVGPGGGKPAVAAPTGRQMRRRGVA